MYIALNEVALNKEFSVLPVDPRSFINELVDFLRNLRRNFNLEGILVLREDIFYSWQISNGYNLKEWLEDDLVDKTYKQYLRVFLSKYIKSAEQIDCNDRFLIKINNDEYNILGGVIALDNEIPMFSISNFDFWQKDKINGEHEKKVDNEIKVETVSNFSHTSSNSEINKITHDISLNKISSGMDLWEKRKELFPNLVFCENVKKQLYDDPEKFHIIRIMNQLECLQGYFHSCSTKFSLQDVNKNARMESYSVQNSPKLKKFRLFKLPNGEKKYFFCHISFTGKFSSGRIYFLPDCPSKKGYIGYIGRHLPTKKY